MSLRIIYGRAGTGKSEYIYNEIDEILNGENKIYIITPEQFSFTAEKKLMLNRKSIINAEVITFNRLAYRVINEIGGIKSNLSKSGKAMLIYSILQEQKNNLIFLNKSDENIDLCIRAISEFKKHGILINDLKEEKDKIDDIYLKNKLNDLILIYEQFENKIQSDYIDETDLLSILAENIDKINLLNNSYVYIDEFAGFTEQEYMIIKKIIKIANNVTITFCVDDLNLDINPNIDIFYTNKMTYKKIINLVDRNEKIEKINLNKSYRFKNDELKYIENYLFNLKIKEFDLENKNINLFLAKNEYTEIENIAKQIYLLVKEKNIRYKEISIITKNIEKYSGITKAIFENYNIPIFIDEKKDLNQNIIVQYILSILNIYINNYSYESVFNYLKTGFLEIDENDIYKFEKYCIKYGIRYNKFKSDFTLGINEKNKSEFENLNNIRKKIINPLINLKIKLDNEKSAKNITREFYLFLTRQNIEKKINDKIKILKQDNFLDLAKEYEETYKIIINILDEINLIFDQDKFSIDKFNKILKIGLKNSGIGKIPTIQDQVIMGDVDRSKSRKSKIVFIIGLNDGVFPSVNKNEGFFNDSDREILKNDGIELARGTLENIYNDNFNIYKSFTIAEEKLFLSYASSDSDGKSLRASNLITKIKKIFPCLIEQSDVTTKKRKIEIINEKKLYEDLILKINELKCGVEPEKLFFVIYKYFEKSLKYNKLLKNNLSYINYSFSENIKKENIDKLYGNNLNTSISKLERYNSCPFSYFLQYILKLKEKEELKVQSLDTGSFMHDVINSFFEEIDNLENVSLGNLTDEQIEIIISKIIEEKLLINSNYIFNATAKYKLLVTRLKRIILKSLKYIIQTLLQSEFNLAGTEVEFSENGKYKPIVLTLDDGKTVEITGKIDRIDIGEKNGKNYVRIIDYKSSVKNLDFNNIYAGLQLQLITYLDAVCKIEDLVPAGVLYFNLLEQIISSNKKLSEEEIEEKIKSNFKMKGLILADVNIVKMHDANLEQGSSEIVPAYIDKSGNLSSKRSSAVTEKQFIDLQKYINLTIKQISEEIFKGNIELKPYYLNKKSFCEFCVYNKMCGFNSGISKKEFKYINKYSKEEILEKIKNE